MSTSQIQFFLSHDEWCYQMGEFSKGMELAQEGCVTKGLTCLVIPDIPVPPILGDWIGLDVLLDFSRSV